MKKVQLLDKKEVIRRKSAAEVLISLTIHPPALDDGAHRVVTQIVQREPNGDHGEQGVPVHRHMVRNGDQREMSSSNILKSCVKKRKGEQFHDTVGAP
jgi:hypothetical protein